MTNVINANPWSLLADECEVEQDSSFDVLEAAVREEVRTYPNVSDQSVREIIKEAKRLFIQTSGSARRSFGTQFAYPIGPKEKVICAFNAVLKGSSPNLEVLECRLDLHEEPTEAVERGVVPSSEQSEEAPIPKLLEVEGRSFTFSPEFILGMKGERDKKWSDRRHVVNLAVVRRAIELKINNLKTRQKKLKAKQHQPEKRGPKRRSESELTFDYYFRHNGRILNLVIKQYPGEQLSLHTGYYMINCFLEGRFGFRSETAYDNWVNSDQVPQI
ncbi:MAG TPA: hypothetical protein VLF94_00220 [Chlamydiales bacterium]|nr:hypothetical protein [Chlamydiales bacterium]